MTGFCCLHGYIEKEARGAVGSDLLSGLPPIVPKSASLLTDSTFR